MQHFEDLWVSAEKMLEVETKLSTFQELVREAQMKLSLLDSLDEMTSETKMLSLEEKARLKTNTMGKLLLVMTQMSSRENINVFAALKQAVDDRKISILEKKYR